MSRGRSDEVWLEDRWRLDRVIGQGAEGTVYLAHDATTGGPCAVKVFDALEYASPDDVARTAAAEVRVAQQVNSPWLVQTRGWGLAPIAGGGQTAWVVMELLKGQTLRAWLEKRGRATNEAQCRLIALNVLEAVDSMHRAGLVHLDLKPENIFLLDPDAVTTTSPPVRIFDFASAAIAGPAQARARGTPWYASPEVCLRTGEVGMPSDVYSLGILLFELFVGRVPLQRGTPEQIVAVHAYGQLDPWPQTATQLPLAPIYRRATLREPWQRFPDAGSLRQALLALSV